MHEQENTTREFRCLLLCSRTHLSPGAMSELYELAQQNIDFGLLCEIAIRHKVEQLLYRALNSQIPDLFPRDYLIPLKQTYEAAFARNLALADNLVTILDQLNSHGIAAIPYKGPVLTQQVYGDLSLRRFFDLDLLVHSSQYPQARKVFESLGYALILKSDWGWECTYVKQNATAPVRIDLHRAIMPPRLPVRFDFNRLRERLVTMPLLDGKNVPTLSPEDLLLVLSAHASKPADRWKKLRYICDIAELLRRHSEHMNWDWILQTAVKLDAYRMILLGLHLSNALLDVELPREVMGQRTVSSWLPALKDHVIEVQLKKTTINERCEIYAHPEFYLGLREGIIHKLHTSVFLSRRALKLASARSLKRITSFSTHNDRNSR